MRSRLHQHLLVSSICILLPAILLRSDHRREWIFQLALLIPYLACSVIAFLGHKLNQERITVTGLVLVAGLFYLHWTAARHLRVFEAFLFTSLALVYLSPEKAWRGWRSWLMALLALVPLFVLHGLESWRPERVALLWAWRVPRVGLASLPHYLLPSAGLLLLGLLAIRDRYLGIFRFYVLGALVPIELAVRSGGGGPEHALGFFCAALLLNYGLFHLYWRKAYLDELTGIPNRRALDERLARLDGNYALAMVDIDHFKKFNDTYGHEHGDDVLKLVATHLAQRIRGEVFRYGGEEIAVIFEGKPPAFAVDEMESARDSLSRREFHLRPARNGGRQPFRRRRGSSGGAVARVTISIGVAGSARSNQTPEEVLDEADQALYRAKQSGRNKVVRSEDTSVDIARNILG